MSEEINVTLQCRVAVSKTFMIGRKEVKVTSFIRGNNSEIVASEIEDPSEWLSKSIDIVSEYICNICIGVEKMNSLQLASLVMVNSDYFGSVEVSDTLGNSVLLERVSKDPGEFMPNPVETEETTESVH
jgi:hypothetical protein